MREQMTADREKRRAISRDAARKRRRVESDVFRDLALLLPLRPPLSSHLDKPSVIRLTLSYLHLRRLFTESLQTHMLLGGVSCGSRPPHRSVETIGWSGGDAEEALLLLSLLEGFVMVVSPRGDVLFLSSNVSHHLGLSQVELMGHSLFHFTHPCDHGELQRNLRLMPEDVWRAGRREFLFRVKSTSGRRGRSMNLKSASWKVLQCRGLLSVSCLLLTCRPLPPALTLTAAHAFSSRHSLDMRFTQCDHRVQQLLGFSSHQLLGRSIYDFCYTPDTESLFKSHMSLCVRCESVSARYRMLVRGGGYVWVESLCAARPAAGGSRDQDQTGILCVTHVLSGVQHPGLQLSLDQSLSRS